MLSVYGVMGEGNDIDLLWNLGPHGWSTLLLLVDGEITQIQITHAFRDPLEDLMDAFSALMRGEMSVVFDLHDEPGGHRFEITRVSDRQHVAQVEIGRFEESFGDLIAAFEPLVRFEVRLRDLLVLVYFQLKKIEQLLASRALGRDRGGEFPHPRFRVFEADFQAFIGR